MMIYRVEVRTDLAGSALERTAQAWCEAEAGLAGHGILSFKVEQRKLSSLRPGLCQGVPLIAAYGKRRAREGLVSNGSQGKCA